MSVHDLEHVMEADLDTAIQVSQSLLIDHKKN